MLTSEECGLQNGRKGRIMPPPMMKRVCAVILAGMVILPLGGCSGVGSLIGGLSQLVGMAAYFAKTFFHIQPTWFFGLFD